MKQTAMTTTKIVTALAIAASAAALAGGCSFYPGAPDEPTYEAAVRPILQSRCVRCHGDPLQGDPTSDLLPPSSPAYALGRGGGTYLQDPPTAKARFDKFEDTNCDIVDGGLPDNCFFGASTFAPTIALYLGDKAPFPMPPPPAPPLTKRELDTVLRWTQEKPPLER
jgi:hypothetical protein